MVNITKSNVKHVSDFTPSTTLVQNTAKKFSWVHSSKDFVEFLDGHVQIVCFTIYSFWVFSAYSFITAVRLAEDSAVVLSAGTLVSPLEIFNDADRIQDVPQTQKY